MDAASQPITLPADDAETRAAIDRAVKWPVFFFFASGGFWLLAAILLGLWANLKLLSPGLFDGVAFLAFPRVQPAHLLALVYGWGFNMAYGTLLWLVCRLCRRAPGSPVALMVAGKIWNISLSLGLLVVLLSGGSGREWLEFPMWTAVMLFIAHTFIAGNLLAVFFRRAPGHTFISLWYAVAALFAFPWLLLTALVFSWAVPGSAVMATAVNSWYVSGLLYLFFLPVGLAATLYFVPKVTGSPLASDSMTLFGFWGLIGIGAWTGMQRLLGGPLPAWMPAVSGAAVICALIPFLVTFQNLRATLRQHPELAINSPTLRFSNAATWGLICFAVITAALATVGISRAAGFTQAYTGIAYAALLGAFGFAMFGSICFVTPRLAGCEWPSGRQLRVQFWATTYGVICLVVTSVLGGVWQGASAMEIKGGWQMVVESMRPYATGQSLAFAFLFAANYVFLRGLASMILQKGRAPGEPTMIHEEHATAPH